MSSETVVRIASEAVFTVLKVSAPLLGLALLVGLVISIFQATTQIQEQTLVFVPKIVAVLVALLVFGPWMLRTLRDFAFHLLDNLSAYVG
ncbi:MAG: flagellar biosynthetic protein FliQ [Candidatus Reconcilbacillus cellulovorans]|uniref:Flagellar biosynthetic protein FliQ n=1 Tax=Candidatus Reconcilbacillus cellulovorans TaxID=1906605 RepID=A0A2A6E1Q4_9BACL|nr:MAG: flagellar biosynthetic protein FliQ [Candidatus Reconcilbacillus cellulovorans]